MKHLLFVFICFLVGMHSTEAQQDHAMDNAQLPTFPLDITWHKTSLLIFPQPIRHADRGDAYVLAETVKDADNILKVKAGKKNFEESNLQVVTCDGKVYSFTVSYRDHISGKPIDMGRAVPYAPVTFPGISLNSKQIEDLSRKVAQSYAFLHGGMFHRYGIRLETQGIYVRDDVLFFQFRIKNETNIPFEPATIRFYIRDRKRAKRTAVQDTEVTALKVLQTGSPESDKGKTIVAAFPRFTIAENKYFGIEIIEKQGDRNPTNRIKQKKLLKARGL
ncbi:conjugative transposon protein TraN [Chitinophaga oryzae]|uniref:Conjugative transposon protein TraN n=1 Tax=Chitinophaga oryzae TaxID=2725414 RepID=A0AAE7DAG0_9BACT|nr:conjugative transposon protein TraN [Chitinophaga oryzae]QJB34920.1 conjugative transposon protein TraN [Chitinophaga oryzae]QJB41431.1 conjugative transposon protein TraN [Chitinophaga oryzae]